MFRVVVFQIVLLFLTASLGIAFVNHGEIASLADDSGTYLVMAQYFAALGNPAGAVEHIYHSESYPPLFPLVLALTGAAHDFVRAHHVVAACFAISCVLLFNLARCYLRGALLPILCTATFILSPSTWINMLGILSENLYLCFSLATLLVYEKWGKAMTGFSWQVAVFGILIALCVLTRTIGFALIPALVIQYVMMRSEPKNPRARVFLPTLIAAAAYTLWSLGGPDPDVTYIDLAIDNYRAVLESDDHKLVTYLARNVAAVASAWIHGLLIFWRDSSEPRFVIATIVGILAMSGTLMRARQGKLDGLYVLCYVAVIVIWPFRSEMPRFLYPLLPLLILHAYVAFSALLARPFAARARSLATVVLPMLFAVVCVPPMGFIAGRAVYAEEGEPYLYRHITQFYEIPELPIAKSVSERMGLLVEDLRRVERTTPPDARVLWVKPNFMALLGRRESTIPPSGDDPMFYQELLEADADYVLVSEAVARGNWDGMGAFPRFAPFSRVVWQRVDVTTGLRQSVLLEIDRTRLEQLAGSNG